jgi:hypothetical protein
MIETGRPFWWINPYFNGDIESWERRYNGAPQEYVHMVRISPTDKRKIETMLGHRKDKQQGEMQFFDRMQKLLDAMNTNNGKAAQLMLKAVRIHYDADQALEDAFYRQCYREYRPKINRNETNETIKSLEADLRRQVGDGTLSFAEADEKLNTAKQEIKAAKCKAESDAFHQFCESGGEERVAAVIWQELGLSPERVRLITEADDFERQALELLG